MTQIKQLKDTSGNFYPVTHKDAVVGLEDIQVDMTGYATELWVKGKGYLTEHLDISGKADVAALNLLSEKLALRELEILTLLGQISDLQTQVNTLLGYYNELENIIG